MGRFFSGERFGRPQLWAGLLLLAFLAQCLWLLSSVGRKVEARNSGQFARIEKGLRLWGGRDSGRSSYAPLSPLGRGEESVGRLSEDEDYDANHSPMWYLIASAPAAMAANFRPPETVLNLHFLLATPFLLFGILLGGSLWYVARRLYGNAGGYIALALYCFSPAIMSNAALWFVEPELGAAWGAFGAVFTAIAVAHTLYAPREVVLWNWRRILLLGLSLALAAGSQFSLVIVVPIALGFMICVAPTRRGAAALIWAAACGFGLVLLFASYFFHAGAFWQGMRHAAFWSVTGRAFAMPGSYRQLADWLGQSSPALLLVLPVALVAYAAWPRTRYFGNSAPLLAAFLFVLLSLGTPHETGLGFHFVALPFLFVFVAGVLADLLETRHRGLVSACVWALLGANAIWNLWQLARVSAGST